MGYNNSDSLTIIKNTVNRLIPGCRIILFGSPTRKDYHPDSDYYFLIISKDTIDIRKKRALKSMMRKELAQLKIPADILIQSESEINSKIKITGHILRQVLREGVALDTI